jgi:hypothetical protein
MADFILTNRENQKEIDKIKSLKGKIESLTEEEYAMFKDLLTEDGIDEEKVKAIQSLIYKSPPPTPRQFLDWKEGWLPRDFCESIREWVEESFLNISDPKLRYNNNKYNTVCFYGATRTGKSFWAVLQMLYTIVYLAHLRDVRGYYKLAPNTVLSMFILSFDLSKVKEVYLEPLYNLMSQSERFEMVKFQDTVPERQDKAGMNKIIYSKATNVGHITLASGLKIVSGNDDVLKIIGSNILSAYISEIAFFIE